MNSLFVLAFAMTFGVMATWLMRGLAHRVGFVDRPDGRRKVQSVPVALGGGLGVAFSVLASLAAIALLDAELGQLILSNHRSFALLGAGAIILLTGLLDDALNLRARQKLLGQAIAVAILIGFGDYRINQVGVFGYQIELGTLSILATAFWFFGTINAINLLDGMDGLLGLVGVIALGAVAWMALAAGNALVGLVALAAVGSIIGFLIFNLPPASIYLGDSGSMLIGLLLASLSLDASLKGPTTAIVAPVVLLVLPLIDTSAAIIRRKLTGRGLAAADRGHLHHELLRHGLNRVRVLCLVGSLALVAAAGALVSSFMQNDLFAFIAGGAVVMILLASGLFGVAEYRLIRERVSTMYHLLRGRQSTTLAVQLQGQTNWNQVWREALSQADDLRLITAILDVNDPARQEGFHARWDRHTETDHFWRLEVTLRVKDKTIGKLTILGEGDTPTSQHFAWITATRQQLERLAGAPETPAGNVAAGRPDLAPQPVISV